MSAPDMVALGRRAMACEGWRWMRGMAAYARADANERRPVQHGGWVRVLGIFGDSTVEVHLIGGAHRIPAEWMCPDLTDPATVGCLLHLVREAWGEPIYTMPGFNGWTAHRPGDHPAFIGGVDRETWAVSEAASLVAALEAAP